MVWVFVVSVFASFGRCERKAKRVCVMCRMINNTVALPTNVTLSTSYHRMIDTVSFMNMEIHYYNGVSADSNRVPVKAW